MKAILVDDERLARMELRRLLAAHPEIEIVAETANAEEAEILIGSLEPDVLFLDVQMPGRSGFDLLASLDRAPHTIFVTAYDEYALRAFEFSAVDYLLKPVAPERLATALIRLKSAGPQAETAATRIPATQQIFVRDGERCWFVRLSDIALFESEGNYTRLYFAANRPLILRSLSYLEARLDPEIFFRTSRRHIVNLRLLDTITPSIDGGYDLKLVTGQQVEMSRRRAQEFREKMSI
ncbi:LytR/AlgR family response regulator transcription factor [Paludibaculum fermentans]|uniref:Response regulator n=1 Tax=Paludibaculum fermentans TaxID=1473598 RepID=A0A7S7NSM4_PALFE|nr:response regulator [Paludibaculum fermentans]QOY88514.1 response regulator [Paludibaculum fermentans]